VRQPARVGSNEPAITHAWVTRSRRGEPLDSSTVVSDTRPSDSIRTRSTTVPCSFGNRDPGGKLSLQNWRSEAPSSGLASRISRSNGGERGSSGGIGVAAEFPGPGKGTPATNGSGSRPVRSLTGRSAGALKGGGPVVEGSRMTSIAVENEVCEVASPPNDPRKDGLSAAKCAVSTARAMRPRALSHIGDHRVVLRGGRVPLVAASCPTPCI
jgi:hypothetical protein